MWSRPGPRFSSAFRTLASTSPGRARPRRELEAAIRRLGAEGRIRLHGHVAHDALMALYRDCDVVALPTLWSEPFGRVPLEAAAAGRPVVAYASGGLTETIVDGVTGRLVARGDRAAFVAALAGLAADGEARARMGAAGRERVVEAYAPARLAQTLATVWDEILNAGEPSAGLRRASAGGR
ncbi:glycosyltransferase [Chenggangzhangella methanolivorans]|uniref:Glycosyltransferase n=1 Tax=Chenggangzhangella methanolivorans TaxID=1437009 RepID=A0A9E6RDQ9_9HYPH|nr:glycosyltransferase [Chenggangzhangella methanolivorans]QZO02547.1 glycosyltransferase [Chenggangzhangella methanolivorans]